MARYTIGFLFLCILGSCSLTDDRQPVPAYLVIDNVDIAVTADQGAPTHKITDVWVYADNQLLGVFELPANIPVIVNGESTFFTVFPGFRNNGERSRSFTYNMLEEQEFTVDLAPGESINREFTFEYRDEAIFDFVEGFEGTSHIFTDDLDQDDMTFIDITLDDPRSGLKSGIIQLTQDNPLFSATTIFTYNGNENIGRDSYLEMDYKNDIPIVLGLILRQDGVLQSFPVIVLKPSDDWNKIYVDFTQQLTSPAISEYKIYFSTDLTSIEAQEGTIQLDNLKFIHF